LKHRAIRTAADATDFVGFWSNGASGAAAERLHLYWLVQVRVVWSPMLHVGSIS